MMFTSGFSASRCPAKMLWTFIVSLLPTCTWHLFVYISSILLLSPWLAHGAAAGVVVEGKEDTRISTAVGIVADKEEIIGFSPIAGAITFFALGDFGGASGSLYSGGNLSWKQQVAERMGLWAAALRPRFVVGLGDNFYDLGVETAQDPAWDAQFESVYAADHLVDVPWLMCLGNHDYAGRPEAQIERTGNDTHGRWYMPSRSYSRVFSQGLVSVEVFSVDTNAISYTLTTETAGSCEFANPVPGCSPRFEKEGMMVIAELERRLNASTALWKVVAGHHPLFSVGHHGSPQETSPLRLSLLPLLERYGVDIYACGHDHIAQHVVPLAPRLHDGEHGTRSLNSRMTESDWQSEAAARATMGASEVGARRPIDHVTIGSSGPMVMAGDYDFLFERGEDDDYDDDHETAATTAPETQTSSEGDVEITAQADGAGSDPGGEVSLVEGAPMKGDVRACPARANNQGFDLWYATKRRAFGVVEAGEDCLRVSLVGDDGEVLYFFTRKR